MVNLFLRSAHVLVALLLLLTPVMGVMADDASEKARELKGLHKSLEAARAEVEGLNARHSEEVKALRKIETQQAAAAVSLHEAREALERQHEDLRSLRQRQAALEASIAKGREGLANSLRALYMMGPGNDLDGVLSPGSRADKLRQEVYLARLREGYAETVSGLRADLEEGQRVVAELEAGLAHLTGLEQAARDEQASLDALRKQQAQAVEAVEGRLKAGETRVHRIRQDQRQLAMLVKKLDEADRRPPPPPPPPHEAAPATRPAAEVAVVIEGAPKRLQAAGKGGIPVDGRLTRRFGEQTGLGELRSDGYFYTTAEGAPVRAVADGRVVFADWMRGYGQLVILQHAGGYLSLYAHNEAIYKKIGVRVKRGEVISAAGRSGGARETGLYFEVRRAGQPVNPARWPAVPRP